MAQTDDDLKQRVQRRVEEDAEVLDGIVEKDQRPPIQERSQPEKQAYIEGYEAAVKDIQKAGQRLQAAVNLAREITL